MKATIPYLNFPGTTAEVFQFYHRVLGGKLSLTKFRDSPMAAQFKGPDLDLIFHADLQLPNHVAIMASDVCGDHRAAYKQGTNVTICLDTESEDEAKRVFTGLSAGGTVTMPIQKTFWAVAFGMFTDRFGIPWMINYSVPGAPH